MAMQRSGIAAWHVLNAVFTGVSEAELKTGRGRVSAAFKLVIYAASVCYFAWYNVAALAVFTGAFTARLCACVAGPRKYAYLWFQRLRRFRVALVQKTAPINTRSTPRASSSMPHGAMLMVSSSRSYG